MEAGDIGDFLDEAGDLTDEMPGYFGPPDQRELLIEYLEELGRSAADDEGSAS